MTFSKLRSAEKQWVAQPVRVYQAHKNYRRQWATLPVYQARTGYRRQWVTLPVYQAHKSYRRQYSPWTVRVVTSKHSRYCMGPDIFTSKSLLKG
jgi:hypothetical protein